MTIVMYFQHKNEEENVLTPKTKPQFLFIFYHIHMEDHLYFWIAWRNKIVTYLFKFPYLYVLDLLSTKEPVLLTAEKIPDEIYWKRCCNDILSNSDVSLHGNSYKRLFLERTLQKSIETFVPQQTDLFDIKDLLNVMEPYIKRLEITELLPPVQLLVRF